MFLQVQFFNGSVDKTFSDCPFDSLDTREKIQILNYSKLLKNCVVLGAVANPFSGKSEPPLHIPASYRDATPGRHYVVC